MTTVWISSDNRQKLLHIERVLMTKNGRRISPIDVEKELVDLWDKHLQRPEIE